MQRAGNRRYYRPTTSTGAANQPPAEPGRLYRPRRAEAAAREAEEADGCARGRVTPPAHPDAEEPPAAIDVFRLIALRNRLAEALQS
jgi:hypothetical protein